MVTKEKITCKQCGKVFVADKSKHRKVCSKRCRYELVSKLHKGKSVSNSTREKISKKIKLQSNRISERQRGSNNPNWKGGYYSDSDGRKLIKHNGHPFSNKKGYIFEHRLIGENKIGRYLTVNEIVHHIDGNVKNNRITNLQVITRGEHTKLHRTKYRQYYDINLPDIKYLGECIVFINNGHRQELISSNCTRCYKLFWTTRYREGKTCCVYKNKRKRYQ